MTVSLRRTLLRTFLTLSLLTAVARQGHLVSASFVPPVHHNHHHHQNPLVPEINANTPITGLAEHAATNKEPAVISQPINANNPITGLAEHAATNKEPAVISQPGTVLQNAFQQANMPANSMRIYMIYFAVVGGLALFLLGVWTFRKHLKPCVAKTEEGCATVVYWMVKPLQWIKALIEFIFYHIKQNLV
eukprot:g36225.t1